MKSTWIKHNIKKALSYDYMKEIGKNDLEIIDSFSRPNTDIDSLLGDFENWLRGQ